MKVFKSLAEGSNHPFNSLTHDSPMQRQTIYWNVGDVVLNTSDVMVELINSKYRIPNNLAPKKREDCKDVSFKSIYSSLTKKQKNELAESEEFWSKVVINQGFLDIVQSGVLDRYRNIFFTRGTQNNLVVTKKYLEDNLRDIFHKFGYIGIPEDGDMIPNMSGAIQIDDKYVNLRDSNAKVKILVKNGVETLMNNSYGMIDTPDNLYNVNSLGDVLDILTFNLTETL